MDAGRQTMLHNGRQDTKHGPATGSQEGEAARGCERAGRTGDASFLTMKNVWEERSFPVLPGPFL